MTENKVRELRKKKKLTQRELAEAAGTSQQQIQRIEAGTQSARFDLALAICVALDAKMTDVFPTTSSAIEAADNSIETIADVYGRRDIRKAFSEAGLDMAPEHWMLKYRLRGGATGILPISGPDRKRLWSLVQGDENRFAVFDSGDRRQAINLKHLLYCHFLFEAFPVQIAEDDDMGTDDLDSSISITFADNSEPLVFPVEPDRLPLSDEAAEWEDVQLQNLFFDLEIGAEERLRFADLDGEVAFFRTEDIAFLSAPIEHVEPLIENDTDVAD
ncbi:helix-turn-helix transcriptional regulator [Stappia sp.]|uniref:helix-turn-helix transcriptional regulator n=1 Tax=Stappia sp. TaxID=1870903 RepID=UPI003C7AD30E